MPAQRRILVTSALPYANGPLHLGHMIEQIQTDIWVRFQSLRGHDCLYVCANDAHGTAVMLRAEKQGLTPEQLIERIQASHRADCAGFLIALDNFYTTHSPENRYFAELIYTRLDGARPHRAALDHAGLRPREAACSCRTATSRAAARAAAPPTSTAIPANPAARPTRRST